MPSFINMPEPVLKLAKAIDACGCRACLVGGGSIDLIQGREPKDWDIEVFGMSYEQLIEIAKSVGEADLIGSKFGVVKVKGCDIDIELSIPRTENKTGPKHKDFDIKLIPDLSIHEAARRRDFTINTIYIDLKTAKVIDEWGGLRDLQDGILNYVDEKTFMEDPLRIFRAIQIVARKCRTISWPLLELMIEHADSCRNLSGDAILGELTKLLMLSDKPSIGLHALEYILYLFPELYALKSCPQKPKHHPEGNTWIHTMMVVDEAAKWRSEVPKDWQLAFMFGALLHDVGKPIALDPITLSTIDHDRLGEVPARMFMSKLTDNIDLTDKICSIVRAHMRPRLLLKAGPQRQAWRRLQNTCPLNILAYISMCDEDGRGELPGTLGKSDPVFIKTMDIFNELGSLSTVIPPILMGRHLIEAGYKPGVQFSVMLEKAYEYQIETGCADIKELLNAAIQN